MGRVIYFVEDERALDPYIFDLRNSRRFPECEIRASDFVEDAIAWSGPPGTKTVFVVDSRMCLGDGIREELTSFLGQHDIKLDELPELETLTGTLGTILLRQRNPDSRIILLSAYARTIDQVRQQRPNLDKLLRHSIDVTLSKTSPSELTRAIQSQLDALKD